MLRSGDREELERRVRCNTVEARDAERARLVLMAADGASNREIGVAIGMHYNQVAVWRRRYGEFTSVDDLADRIIAFINDYNRRAKPFRWTYDGRPLKVA